MDRNPNLYNVRAVERAMQILSAFDGQHSLGVSEVAQATGLHKATAHRILMTLVNHGFLERAGDGERFRLGLRLMEMGLGALRGLDFRRAAFPYMQQLVERFGETCTLSIFDRGQMLYVDVVYSEHSLTIGARVGRHLPIHCTASGKALLAFLPPEITEPILEAPLPPYTPNTITSPEQLGEELRLVRQRGYALSYEEFETGIAAISVPIRDIAGKVIAAMSIAFPTSRLKAERLPEMAQALLEVANVISAHG